DHVTISIQPAAAAALRAGPKQPFAVIILQRAHGSMHLFRQLPYAHIFILFFHMISSWFLSYFMTPRHEQAPAVKKATVLQAKRPLSKPATLAAAYVISCAMRSLLHARR